MDTATVLNYSLNLSALVVTALLVMASLLGGNLKERVFRLFFLLVLLNLAGILCEAAIALLMGHAGRGAGAALHLFEWFSHSMGGGQIAVYGVYFYTYLKEKTTVSKLLPALSAGLALCTVLLAAAAQFTGLFARFDALNVYHRQDSYWLAQLFPLLAMLLFLFFTLRHIGVLRPKEWFALLLYPLIPILCFAIEQLFPGLFVGYVGATLALLLLYINIQVELRQRMARQEAEMERLNTALMLSQIQPHFLYNTLVSIQDLCEGNPEAQQALLAFSKYLRQNMDALAEDRLIPFEKEMEHVRQYLWLEQLRFEERLRVEVALGAVDFALPALTLQPIVENAVRYGVTQKVGGGTLRICTGETGEAFRIEVEDDGAGFDPDAPVQDGRSHTGIANVKARLAALCGGRLTVESAPGKGTRAVIEIPKEGGTAR